MQAILSYLPYIQIVLSVLLMAGILLQQSSAGLGGAFGDNFDSSFHSRRGSEKVIFNATLIIAILFAVSASVSFIFR
jgi:preprotein translocase subunit SecG